MSERSGQIKGSRLPFSREFGTPKAAEAARTGLRLYFKG